MQVVVVTQGGRPAGVVTQHELVCRQMWGQLGPNESHVGNILSTEVVDINKSMDVWDALKVVSRRLSRLVVRPWLLFVELHRSPFISVHEKVGNVTVVPSFL